MAKIDCSAEALFSRLWVLNTHSKKKEHLVKHHNLPRVVWENLDGTRSLQVRSFEERSDELNVRIYGISDVLIWNLRT